MTDTQLSNHDELIATDSTPLPESDAEASEQKRRIAAEAEVERLRDENLSIGPQQFIIDSLLTRLAAADALAEAATRLKDSDKVFHGLKHSDVDSAWGDTEKCDLCALRAALAAYIATKGER